MSLLIEIGGRLLTGDSMPRTEADIQSDIRDLLLYGGLDLGEESVQLESPVGDLRRIDVEVGRTVIEVKKSLGSEPTVRKAIDQLAGYVTTRRDDVGQRYTGVLTDGVTWKLFNLVADELVEVSTFHLSTAADTSNLVSWLNGALATVGDIPASPSEIVSRLGIDSSAHMLDRASVTALYEQYKELPTVVMKRTLWARLLETALGTQFTDDDDLFITHTLLVNMAEIIAHAVVGLEVSNISPASLLRGGKFEVAHISGVVESDFFDWVLEVEGGPEFIKALAQRLGRFAWDGVDQDVMKVIYESVIGPETRKRLGEYYTPDWLARAVVLEAVQEPLSQRVLDPSCGSGTFLFHAVKHYLQAAEDRGDSVETMLTGVAQSVSGMDLHPVAVALARVTYLLAIGTEKITDPERGPIAVPVFLGDSLQWDQESEMWSAGSVVIKTDDGAELFSSEMKFPASVVAKADNFDQLIRELADKSANRTSKVVPDISGVLNRLAIASEDRDDIESAFNVMCRLHDEGRDHIWGYYIRNRVRPAWLSIEENKVDVLVGNPPWLAFRHMPGEMQERFRDLSQSRGLWSGKKMATHQDLSALFIARSIQLYLNAVSYTHLTLPTICSV